MGLCQGSSLRLKLMLLVIVAVIVADGSMQRRYSDLALGRPKRMLYDYMPVNAFGRHICAHTEDIDVFLKKLYIYLSGCTPTAGCSAPKDVNFVKNLVKELCHDGGKLLDVWVAELYNTNGDEHITSDEMGEHL